MHSEIRSASRQPLPLNSLGNESQEPGSSQRHYWLWMLVCVVLLGVVAMKVRHLQTAHIIRDEFEHMHAVWLVHNGQTPFADFFEHHTPLFYFLGAVIVPLRDPGFHTMIVARYEALIAEILVIFMAWGWVRQRFGSGEALVVAALFCINVFLFLYGGFSYLDSYGAPLLLASAVLLDGKRTSLRMALSGLAFGISFLLAIKAMMAAFAYIAYFLVRGIKELPGEGRKVWFKHVAWFIVGGLLSCLPILVMLGESGLRGFWLDTVVMNSRWKVRYFPYEVIRLLATTDPLIYVTALAAAFGQIWSLAKRGWTIEDRDLPAVFLISLCVGIFLIPIVWEEYYLLILPFALILAGLALTDFARRYLMREGSFLPFAAGVDLRASLLVLVAAALMAFPAFTEVGHLSRLGALRLGTMLAAWGVLLLVLARQRKLSRRVQAALWIAVLSVYPLQQQAYLLVRGRRNDDQRARVNYVMANTKPTDTVFDGNSGYGVFRQHAFQYWLLHDEVQAMLTPEEKGPMLIAALEKRKPPIVIVDRFTLMLPPQVLDYVNSHYETTPYSDIRKRRPEK
jgi:hypothetical protein